MAGLSADRPTESDVNLQFREKIHEEIMVCPPFPRKIMKKTNIGLLAFLCLIIQGCGSIYYLDRHDRIPQERHKGYVKFFSAFDTDSREGLNPPAFTVMKQEHGYDFKIAELAIPSESVPISDRLGGQKYIVLYPDRVACRVKGGLDNISEAEKAVMEEFEISEQPLPSPSMEWAGSSSFAPREFIVTIEKNMVTPVGLNASFTFEQEKRLVVREGDGGVRKTDDSVKIYTGTLREKTGKPSSIAVVAEEGVIFSGPRVYDLAPPDVFARALEAAESLGWDIKESNRDKGHLLVGIPRLFEQNTISFDVGIFSVGPEQTQVDLSSHSWWQRWGSHNMALSREKMYEFYSALDGLVSTDR